MKRQTRLPTATFICEHLRHLRTIKLPSACPPATVLHWAETLARFLTELQLRWQKKFAPQLKAH
jgi:hypothetical protein